MLDDGLPSTVQQLLSVQYSQFQTGPCLARSVGTCHAKLMNPKLALAGASEPSGAIDPLQSWWMPFTHNRRFKAKPHLIESAAGAYYTLADKGRVFDCLSGMWCTPIGHSHPGIVRAVSEQVQRLDYSPGFQLGHKPAFELAARIAALAGRPNDRVFFTNSGSESVDTALKIAIAYHRVRGAASRTRIIGRERGYHGVGLGGISVGGIASN